MGRRAGQCPSELIGRCYKGNYLKTKTFDILIVGAGHAGLEASHMAAQFGLRVGLLTMPKVAIGSTPCNPSIGGVGKGQVVREIDCLGGLMGKLADQAAIHYKTLNESKGYAVRSTRVQIDKELYSRAAEEELSKINNLQIIRKSVQKITKKEQLFHIISDDGEIYLARKVIMTTGTFLAGKLHRGQEQMLGGRIGHQAVGGLRDIFQDVETLKVRFKTGTPPRIYKNSIAFKELKKQPSDVQAKTFHWDNKEEKRHLSQVFCFITHTNSKTLEIIRDNKDHSPLFNGQIKGIGPRYCPSIEDKAYRYVDRDIHHIFLEPEGLELETIYPSGISTSLPKDVQLRFLRTINGLENCEVAVYGYAVEYDVVNTAKLTLGLEYRDIPGLYFAGQINGTSGYEEAAAQGLVAGINACYSLQGRGLFQIDRSESYIGVLIDDLVGQKRDEPYRLFTARNENRLYVREDNTFLRMIPYRKKLGFSQKLDFHLKALEKEYKALSALVSHYVFKRKVHEKLFRDNHWDSFLSFSSGGLKFTDLIKNPRVHPVDVLHGTLKSSGLSFHERVIETVAIGEIYRGYIERSHRELKHQRTLDRAHVNLDFLLNSHNVSFECKQRIREAMPETFGQLRRIEGIRPATLVYISTRL